MVCPGREKQNLFGNPDLKPEESVSYEAGVYYDNPAGLNANVTGFITSFSNKIVSYSINDNTNSYVNSGKARLHGVKLPAHCRCSRGCHAVTELHLDPK